MGKITLGPQTLIYPMPAYLIGANVDGKPNFMTAAWCGIVCSDPATLSVSVQPRRYTHEGILQNRTFSVNIPSVELVKEADYCGIASGASIDKAKVCKFKVFYGNLGNAPLIEQCPVNLECKVVHTLSLGSHSLFIGRIEEVYVSDDCLTDGKPDVEKIRPFVYCKTLDSRYYALGNVIGKAYDVGKELGGKE